MFTEQHYDRIAGLIADHATLTKDNVDQAITWFADMFEGDNPAFDREKFIKACRSNHVDKRL